MTSRAKLYSRAAAKRKKSVETAKSNPTEQNVSRALKNMLIASAGEANYKKLSESAADYLAKQASRKIVSEGKTSPKVVEEADTQAQFFLEKITSELGTNPAYINYVRPLREQRKFCGVDPWC